MTEVHFTINWSEVGKAILYIAIGAGLVIGVFAWIFKDFRPYK